MSPATKQLIDALCCLQGVGPKTAQRMAFQLLAEPNREKGHKLTNALHTALNTVTLCNRCRCYTEQDLCLLCCNLSRTPELLCVVESPADIIAIEETQAFKGFYFVLHGHLSPLDGIGPDEIAIPQLFNMIQKRSITDIIIATNPTMEGKATAHYIATHVASNVTCSQLAHGVPLGGELEYLDGGTLAHALQMRTTIKEKIGE